jgi:hypothetical protein
MADSTPEQKKQIHEFVKFHHKKSGFFRVVHADGAWGGANLGGLVHLTFYSEHPAIPTSVTFPVDKNGVMIDTPTEENNDGWHREMEISVAMTLPAAMQVRATIDNFIKVAVAQMNELKQRNENATKQAENK